jgi:DNA (cytosine-5)-methyltransferase 1
MNHLDLFSGIGGFRLALDLCQIPIEHSYHSDIEEYANRVYSKNYPDSVSIGDIRCIDGKQLRERHPGPWIVTGGFPCQDISTGGKRKGLSGERSGLWYEMLRVIGELKPELAFIENVAALRNRGLIDVLRGLDGIGYAAEWRTLSAQEIGAIHQRKRLWIIATPQAHLGDADSLSNQMPHELSADRRDLGNVAQRHCPIDGVLSRTEWAAIKAEGSILGQPLVARKDDGLPHWMDRIKAVGNAIVPQCAAKVLSEWLDRA